MSSGSGREHQISRREELSNGNRLSDAVIGNRLRSARGASGMTLKGVEKATSGAISSAVLSSYERGEHSIPAVRLCTLSDLYGVSVADLTAREVIPTVSSPVSPKESNTIVRLDVGAITSSRVREVSTVAKIANSVQSRRRSKSSGSIVLRSSDLEIAAATLGLTTDDLIVALSTAGTLRRQPGRPRSPR